VDGQKVLCRVFREDILVLPQIIFDVRCAKKDHFRNEQSGKDQNHFHPSKNVSQKRGRLRGKITKTLSAKITIKLCENALLKLNQYYRSQHFSYAFCASGQTTFAESTTINSFF
jgi:hypothetical protein